MSVNATSEGGLAISFDGNAWGIVATADAVNVSLKPVSTHNMTNWYHAMATSSNAPDGDDKTRDEVTSSIKNSNGYIANSGANKYVVAKTFKIRSTGVGDTLSKGLYVSNITVTGTKQMHTALRVGIICDYKDPDTGDGPETGPFIYGPVTLESGVTDNKNGPSTTYSVYRKGTDTDVDDQGKKLSKVEVGSVTLKDYGDPGIPLLADDITIANDSDNPVVVTVLIWFEGEDQNLTSDKYDASTLDVTVEFSSLSAANTSGNS